MQRIKFGIPGLDELLGGGVPAARAYLITGGPGNGKTTMGAHFLHTGLAQGEACLFISLSERPGQLIEDVGERGLDLRAAEVLDLRPTSKELARVEGAYTVFDASVSEGPSATAQIIEVVERVKPKRVFIDSLTHIRYLTDNGLSYRKQAAALLAFLYEQGCTVLATAEATSSAPDLELQYLCDGVFALTRQPERTLEIAKCRGTAFLTGRHSLSLTDAGMVVYPRLIPADYGREMPVGQLPSGIPSLDRLLAGGLDKGTITILTGPSGVGKTTLGFQFMKEAAVRGQRSVAYVFDESLDIVRRRCDSVGIPLSTMETEGTLHLERVEPLRYSSDALVARVRREVEERGATLVMIDSVAGYRLSVRGNDLVASLHAVTKYLQNMGVSVILTNEVENVTGEFSATGAGLSYLADTVVFMRYLEVNGELHKSIGVLKKRLSDFEKTLRRFRISADGIEVGEPLTGLRGILSGIPEFISASSPAPIP